MGSKNQVERIKALEHRDADKRRCACVCSWGKYSDFAELSEERARAILSILESLEIQLPDGSRTNLLEALPARGLTCFCSH